MSNQNIPEISVVVLCYHSGQTILPIFNDLETLLTGLNVNYEIILVANDFHESKDETAEIVKKLALDHPFVKPITKIKEGMMGWDMMQGMNGCSGKYICVIDGDGQFPIDSIRQVYELIKTKNYDLVKTYRIKRLDGLYRRIISTVYNTVFRILFPNIQSIDVNSKPKIMSKEVYSRLNLEATDWFIDAEIMIKARKFKLRIKEIPIVFEANNSRESYINYAAILEFIRNLIAYKFKKI